MDVCIVCYYRQDKLRQTAKFLKDVFCLLISIYWMTIIIIVWLMITFGTIITLKNIFMPFNIYKNSSFMLSLSWFFIFISCPLHSGGILHILLSLRWFANKIYLSLIKAFLPLFFYMVRHLIFDVWWICFLAHF